MSNRSTLPDSNSSDLLTEFQHILASDPLIDEVGFIHPSQFDTLNEESGYPAPAALEGSGSGYRSLNFWCKDHKLGVSSKVLVPLYKAAKSAFFEAMRLYKLLDFEAEEGRCLSSFSGVESEVMKHSKAVLILSCDFCTAWSSRKIVLSRKEDVKLFMNELCLSALVLSYSPKSDSSWCHRRWVIKTVAAKCSTLPEIVKKESELVEKISEKSKMNYRAWNHRCWLVYYMTQEQVLHELQQLRTWAGLHVADSSCFHYRRRLLLKLLEDPGPHQNDVPIVYTDDIYQLWKDELDWNENLVKRYVGREALWLHRRFLALCWIRHFAGSLTGETCKNDQEVISHEIITFLDNELRLVKSCTIIPDKLFEDFQAQAVHSVTYMLWLIKQMPELQKNEQLQERFGLKNLKNLLAKVCPERSFLWIDV